MSERDRQPTTPRVVQREIADPGEALKTTKQNRLRKHASGVRNCTALNIPGAPSTSPVDTSTHVLSSWVREAHLLRHRKGTCNDVYKYRDKFLISDIVDIGTLYGGCCAGIVGGTNIASLDSS